MFFGSIGIAQNEFSEIAYQFKINQGSAILDTYLLINHKKNHSTHINTGFIEVASTNKETISNMPDGSVNVEKFEYATEENENPEYQKFYNENRLNGYERVYGESKYAITHEPIPTIKWNIEAELQYILDHKVQKATARFRGRDYVAWFAPDIKIFDGPYKFHGLPGLILHIYTIDFQYEWKVYKLNLFFNNHTLNIKTLEEKYPKANKYTLSEKLKKIKENEEKERKYQMSRNSGITDYKIENSGIELEY